MCNVLFFLPLQSLGAVFCFHSLASRGGKKTHRHVYYWGRSEVTTALDRTLLRWRRSWTESQVHQSLPSRPIARRAAPGSNLHPPRLLRPVLPLAVSPQPSRWRGPRVSGYLAAERPEHRSAIGFSADRLFSVKQRPHLINAALTGPGCFDFTCCPPPRRERRRVGGKGRRRKKKNLQLRRNTTSKTFLEFLM